MKNANYIEEDTYMYCRKCGKLLKQYENFCEQCGTKVQINDAATFRQKGNAAQNPMSSNNFEIQLLYQTDCLSDEEKMRNWLKDFLIDLFIIGIMVLVRVARKDWGMIEYWRYLDIIFYILLIILIITMPIDIIQTIYLNNAKVYFYSGYLEGTIYRKTLVGNFGNLPQKIKLQYGEIQNIQPYKSNSFLVTTNKETVLLRVQNPEIVYKIMTNRR